jgi:hypothetical protein
LVLNGGAAALNLTGYRLQGLFQLDQTWRQGELEKREERACSLTASGTRPIGLASRF